MVLQFSPLVLHIKNAPTFFTDLPVKTAFLTPISPPLDPLLIKRKSEIVKDKQPDIHYPINSSESG